MRTPTSIKTSTIRTNEPWYVLSLQQLAFNLVIGSLKLAPEVADTPDYFLTSASGLLLQSPMIPCGPSYQQPRVILVSSYLMP